MCAPDAQRADYQRYLAERQRQAISGLGFGAIAFFSTPTLGPAFADCLRGTHPMWSDASFQAALANCYPTRGYQSELELGEQLQQARQIRTQMYRRQRYVSGSTRPGTRRG